jgi:phenylacetate-CoA ligase
MANMWTQLYKYGTFTTKAVSLFPSFPVFLKWYKFLQKSQWWSKEQLEEYQLEKLHALVRHAYEHVPYYTRVFDERGLKPKDIQDFKDLQLLPFLTKDIVRDHFQELKARNLPESAFERVNTGGTVKITAVDYEKGVSRAREWAFIKTIWDRVGYHFVDKCVILRGYRVSSKIDGALAKQGLFGRWLMLSPFDLTENNIPRYIELMRRFKPRYIQAYPSIILIIAQYMKYHGMAPITGLRGILAGSEGLSPMQKQFLEEVFHCPVLRWYGHAEQAVLAGECELSDNYHVFREYGILELVDQRDKVIDTRNKTGEIVATGLHNFTMPLIRYKTEDLSQYAPGGCSCGREYPLLADVEGRLHDFIVCKNQRVVSLNALINAVRGLERFPPVLEVQYIQEQPGEIMISLVRGPGYKNEDDRKILDAVHDIFGDQLNVQITYADAIPRKKNGKYLRLIQKLPVGFGDYHD